LFVRGFRAAWAVSGALASIVGVVGGTVIGVEEKPTTRVLAADVASRTMDDCTRKKASARSLLGWKDGYHAICREERNVAAIFYHLLLQGTNLRRFLDRVDCKLPIRTDEIAIYFEYAFLRDLWNARVRDVETARSLILDLLVPSNADELRRMSVLEVNEFFGAVPVASREYIQMPGKWSIERFAGHITDNDAFLRTCRFKWAFNAKPDIVIHTTHDTAVCVEAKIESGEGQYPTNRSEIAEFKRRGIPLQKQTDLQTYILRELLGIEAEFIYLVATRTAPSATHHTITWADAFDASQGCKRYSELPSVTRRRSHLQANVLMAWCPPVAPWSMKLRPECGAGCSGSGGDPTANTSTATVSSTSIATVTRPSFTPSSFFGPTPNDE